MIYDINHIWSAEMKWNWRNDRRSERNLCNCVKNSEKKKTKKTRTSTEFEHVTTRYRCDVPVKEMSVNDIWNKSYMNCGNEMKMKKSSSQWTQFMQLRKEAWKKIQDFNGVWTRDLAILVQCSTNWAMKPLTLGAGQLWVHMFPWKKWVLMIYEINHIWKAFSVFPVPDMSTKGVGKIQLPSDNFQSNP